MSQTRLITGMFLGCRKPGCQVRWPITLNRYVVSTNIGVSQARDHNFDIFGKLLFRYN